MPNQQPANERPVLMILFGGLCSPFKNTQTSAVWAWAAYEDGHEVATNSGVLPSGEGMSSHIITYMAAVSALEYVTARGNSYALQRRRSGMYARIVGSNEVVVGQIKGTMQCEADNLRQWLTRVHKLMDTVTMPTVFEHQSGGTPARVREICEAVREGVARQEAERMQKVRETNTDWIEFDAGDQSE